MSDMIELNAALVRMIDRMVIALAVEQQDNLELQLELEEQLERPFTRKDNNAAMRRNTQYIRG
jgi:hypothetical protein